MFLVHSWHGAFRPPVPTAPLRHGTQESCQHQRRGIELIDRNPTEMAILIQRTKILPGLTHSTRSAKKVLIGAFLRSRVKRSPLTSPAPWIAKISSKFGIRQLVAKPPPKLRWLPVKNESLFVRVCLGPLISKWSETIRNPFTQVSHEGSLKNPRKMYAGGSRPRTTGEHHWL